MFNFPFIKSQFRNVIAPLIIFSIILVLLILPCLGEKYWAESEIVSATQSGSSSQTRTGAFSIINLSLFGPPTLAVILGFTLILNHILLVKELEKGYLASWLTLPMSRKRILNSKFFVLLTSVFILYGTNFLVQIIVFPIKFPDFKWQAFAYLVLFNFGLLLFAGFWATINWVFVTTFNKTSLATSLASAIGVLFIVFQIFVVLSNLHGLEYFKFSRYLTIASFLNSPFVFGPIPSIMPEPGVTELFLAPLLKLKAASFDWQYPLMFIVGSCFFLLGKYLFNKKDLPL